MRGLSDMGKMLVFSFFFAAQIMLRCKYTQHMETAYCLVTFPDFSFLWYFLEFNVNDSWFSLISMLNSKEWESPQTAKTVLEDSGRVPQRWTFAAGGPHKVVAEKGFSKLQHLAEKSVHSTDSPQEICVPLAVHTFESFFLVAPPRLEKLVTSAAKSCGKLIVWFSCLHQSKKPCCLEHQVCKHFFLCFVVFFLANDLFVHLKGVGLRVSPRCVLLDLDSHWTLTFGFPFIFLVSVLLLPSPFDFFLFFLVGFGHTVIGGERGSGRCALFLLLVGPSVLQLVVGESPPPLAHKTAPDEMGTVGVLDPLGWDIL